ncbi:conserved hypothetical protein [Candidatus Sulfopaludibacter sp. SbA6]|nr:conserved hypothetical protein [Candidatus Sulfopaludibacter sp. SbA6]
MDLTPALKQDAGAGGVRLGAGKALMACQAALSLVLLFGASLFMRTLVNLESLDPGFDRENLLLFGVDAARAGYQGAALNDFYGRVQQRIATLPGVVSAAASMHLLLSGNSRNKGLWVPGYTPRPGERMHVPVVPAGPSFFHTMKIPLLRGRDFSERDDQGAPKVAVVNEAFVRRYFANQDPIGRRIAWDRTKAYMEIVGVAKDGKYYSLRSEPPATVYHPFRRGRRAVGCISK